MTGKALLVMAASYMYTRALQMVFLWARQVKSDFQTTDSARVVISIEIDEYMAELPHSCVEQCRSSSANEDPIYNSTRGPNIVQQVTCSLGILSNAASASPVHSGKWPWSLRSVLNFTPDLANM